MENDNKICTWTSIDDRGRPAPKDKWSPIKCANDGRALAFIIKGSYNKLRECFLFTSCYKNTEKLPPIILFSSLLHTAPSFIHPYIARCLSNASNFEYRVIFLSSIACSIIFHKTRCAFGRTKLYNMIQYKRHYFRSLHRPGAVELRATHAKLMWYSNKEENFEGKNFTDRWDFYRRQATSAELK